MEKREAPSRRRITREELNMSIVALIAMRSQCVRGQVGCIITQDNRIVSSGYNNPVSGDDAPCYADPVCDPTRSCQRSVHAELNAISAAAKNGITLNGATMWCHWSPCTNCAKAIISAGISEFHYVYPYAKENTLDYLRRAGIRVVRHNPEAISVNAK